MRRNQVFRLTTIMVLTVVTFSAPKSVLGQTSSNQLAQKYKELAEAYKAQVDEYKAQVNDMQKLIESLRAEKATMQSLLQTEEGKLIEKEKQIAALQDNQKDLRSAMEVQQKMLGILEQGTKDRDAVIKELAKGNKRSTWEKIAESLPALATIIALGLAK
jgi:chromosome segregation ATPase